jgi:predicted RNA-binding Zn-ribbon protein involved in translation (DUF1610 family)
MAGKKQTGQKPVAVKGTLICRDCGAMVDVTEKPSTVHCPKCGMSFTITRGFKGKA